MLYWICLNDPRRGGSAGGDEDSRHFNDLGMRRRDPRLDMQVPERILVAGGDQHVASRAPPRELLFERSVLPPALDDVRVSTPPRSIRLDEHSFPSATDDEGGSTPTLSGDGGSDIRKLRMAAATASSGGDGGTTADAFSDYGHRKEAPSPLALASDGVLMPSGRDSLSPHEELQLIRRQLAKLNHRLMAVELENQQQQQREMILTLMVSAYFVGKIFMWLQRSL
jgi:hypothetical protein